MALKMGTLGRINDLATDASVELMTHPVYPDEYNWLMGDGFRELSARTTSFPGLSQVNPLANLQTS